LNRRQCFCANPEPARVDHRKTTLAYFEHILGVFLSLHKKMLTVENAFKNRRKE
jgi:hypothetical protein